MEITDEKKELLRIVSAAGKSGLSSLVPVLGPILAGWDAYKQNIFNRNVQNLIESLRKKVDNLEQFVKNEWFRTEQGEQFVRKVIDAALDEQLQEKQEFFINVFINGARDQTTPQLEKLKFVDMLRHLSLAALMVLAEMHKMLIGQVRGPKRQPDPLQPYPLVDASNVAEKLSYKYDPYLVTSAISEMESQGLFSRTGEWRKDISGKSVPGGGFATELCYTDFADRFVEFITIKKNKITSSG